MRITKSRIAVAAAATATTAAVLAFTAGSATAALPTAVQSGTYSATSAPQSVTASLSTSPIVFTDQTSAAKPKLSCTSLSASGTTTAGHHNFYGAPSTFTATSNTAGSTATPTAAGTDDTVASVAGTSGSFGGCTNNIVGPVNITGSGSWKLWLENSTPTTGTITGGYGYLGGITAHVAAASGTCSFDVAGWVSGTYTGSTGVLTADSTVTGMKITTVPVGTSCAAVGVAINHLVSVSGAIKLAPNPVLVAP